jgi:hypothetical protein
MESGYVRYYRDPLKHPDRQYIGVVFDKDQQLPTPPNAARRRRLNMLPVKREAPAEPTIEGEVVLEGMPTDSTTTAEVTVRADAPKSKLKHGNGYATRKTNWEIGRVGEEMEKTVKKFVPGDRWTAWRKSAARKRLNAERKKLRNAQKASKPKRKERKPR